MSEQVTGRAGRIDQLLAGGSERLALEPLDPVFQVLDPLVLAGKEDVSRGYLVAQSIDRFDTFCRGWNHLGHDSKVLPRRPQEKEFPKDWKVSAQAANGLGS